MGEWQVARGVGVGVSDWGARVSDFFYYESKFKIKKILRERGTKISK